MSAMLVGCVSTQDLTVPPLPSAPPTATDDPATDGFASFLYRTSVTELDAQQLPVSETVMVVDGAGAIHWQTEIPMDADLPDNGIPFIAGPAAGLIAWGTTDGVAETVHIVSIATGEERTFGAGPLGFSDALFDRSGDALLGIVGPLEARQLARFEVHGGTPQVIAELPSVPRGNGIAQYFNPLLMTPDGTRIVDQICDLSEQCAYTVVTLATGATASIAPKLSGKVASLGDDIMLAFDSTGCVGMCSYTVVDLASGQVRPFDDGGGTWDPQVAKTELGDDVFVFTRVERSARTPQKIVLRDIETDAERVLAIREADSPDYLVSYTWRNGLALPPGTVAVAPNGQPSEGPPKIIRLRDGREFPLAPIEP